MISAVCMGAGGHAEVLIEILHMRGEVSLAGLLDPGAEPGTTIAGVSLLGSDDLLPKLRREGVSHAFIGVGGFGDSAPRRKIAEKLTSEGFEVLSVIHPSAIISPSAQIESGLIALAGSIVGCGARLGQHVILNTACSVDHHCRIGHFSHLAPGVRLGGRVELGEAVHLGVGACVRDGLKLGDRAVVGAGAAVVDNLPGDALYTGIPARIAKPLQKSQPWN